MPLWNKVLGGAKELTHEFGTATVPSSNNGLIGIANARGSNAVGPVQYLSFIGTQKGSSLTINSVRYDASAITGTYADELISVDNTDSEHNGIGSAFYDPIEESGSETDDYTLTCSTAPAFSFGAYYRFWGKVAQIVHSSSHSNDLTPGFSYTAEVGDIVIVIGWYRNATGTIADMSDFTKDLDEDTSGTSRVHRALAYSRVMDTAGTYNPEFTVSDVTQQYTTHIYVVRAV